MTGQTIYSVSDDGNLVWHRHLGSHDGSRGWEGPHTVGAGWSFDHTFSGGRGALYAVNDPGLDPVTGRRTGGRLLWHWHDGWAHGVSGVNGDANRQVGTGWNFRHIFAAGNGVIYAVEATGLDPATGRRTGGRLLWYRHEDWIHGNGTWAGGGGGIRVGTGWNFAHVFAGSDGVIYGVTESGDLLWYRHLGWRDGSSTWAVGSSNKIGSGWNFARVFAGVDGVIYGVTREGLDPTTGRRTGGELLWYRHDGWRDGSVQWAVGGMAVSLGKGWHDKRAVFSSPATDVPASPAQRRCGVLLTSTSDTAIRPNTFGIAVRRWGPTANFASTNLTWSVNPAGALSPANNPLSLTELSGPIANAMSQWAAAAQIGLTQVPADGHIQIGFVSALPDESDERFGRAGGTLAVGYPPEDGRVLFDAGDRWSATSLLTVGLHEIGHALGLPHSTDPTSIMYPFDLGGAMLDPKTIRAVQDLYGWADQRLTRDDRGSVEGPSLALVTSRRIDGTATDILHKAWRGIDGDDSLWWSAYDGMSWSPQRPMPGMGSEHGPAITAGFTAGLGASTGLFMACDGVPGDQSIWYSKIDDTVAGEWEQQRQVPYVFTSDRPAVAMFNGALWMAWKGPDDTTIWWATFDGANWSEPHAIRGAGTTNAPALAVVGSRLYLACTGIEGDRVLYYSWVDAGPAPIWRAFSPITYPDVTIEGTETRFMMSSRGPALTARDGELTLACRGVADDSTIYVASFDGAQWSGPVYVHGAATSATPSLATLDGRLHMVWKGHEDDTALWHSMRPR